jgi:two-component system, chemotaxis family, chemotaxis protein CheY
MCEITSIFGGLEDGDGTEVIKAMADARFAGSVIVISGMLLAALPQGPMQDRWESSCEPAEADRSGPRLRVCLANLTKVAMGLPVIHTWGGVAADTVAELHRPENGAVGRQKVAPA